MQVLVDLADDFVDCRASRRNDRFFGVRVVVLVLFLAKRETGLMSPGEAAGPLVVNVLVRRQVFVLLPLLLLVRTAVVIPTVVRARFADVALPPLRLDFEFKDFLRLGPRDALAARLAPDDTRQVLALRLFAFVVQASGAIKGSRSAYAASRLGESRFGRFGRRRVHRVSRAEHRSAEVQLAERFEHRRRHVLLVVVSVKVHRRRLVRECTDLVRHLREIGRRGRRRVLLAGREGRG